MKAFCGIVLIVITLLFSSCQSKDVDDTFIANTNPKITIDEKTLFSGLNIVPETDYSNISAFTENNSYKISTEKIFYTIRNNNVGKGFYFFEVPFIEKHENDSWVRLNYQPPELSHEQLLLCGEEGNTTEPQETRMVFIPKYVKDKLLPGEYRLVIFAEKEIIYAQFRFEK